MPFLNHVIKWEINIIAIDHVIKTKQEKYFLLLLRHDIYTMWARGNIFGGKYILLLLRMSPRKVWLMVIHATFKNISVISWLSVLLVEETGVPRENHRPVASHWQTLSHNVISSTPHQLLVVIGTYCTVSCKSNYHTITATTAIQNKTKYEKTLLLLRHEIYTDTGD